MKPTTRKDWWKGLAYGIVAIASMIYAGYSQLENPSLKPWQAAIVLICCTIFVFSILISVGANIWRLIANHEYPWEEL